MKNTDFTPGPWRYTQHYKHFAEGQIFSVGADKVVAAQIIGAASESQEQLGANGRLMALSPEMFDALVIAESALFYALTEGEFDTLATETDVRNAYAAVKAVLEKFRQL